MFFVFLKENDRYGYSVDWVVVVACLPLIFTESLRIQTTMLSKTIIYDGIPTQTRMSPNGNNMVSCFWFSLRRSGYGLRSGTSDQKPAMVNLDQSYTYGPSSSKEKSHYFTFKIKIKNSIVSIVPTHSHYSHYFSGVPQKRSLSLSTPVLQFWFWFYCGPANWERNVNVGLVPVRRSKFRWKATGQPRPPQPDFYQTQPLTRPLLDSHPNGQYNRPLPWLRSSDERE